MTSSASNGFATRAIHHAYDPQDHEGALTPPLHLTSTFAFETAEAGGEMFAGERPGHIYSRISNPTCDLLEQRIATLEGAEAGLPLSSGMGAITATLWTLLSPGDEVIVDKRVARFFARQLFHLLGYRQLEDAGKTLIMRRRRFDEARYLRRPPKPTSLG